MTCSNVTTEFVGETHTCIGLPGHDGFHSCGCTPARMWSRLNEQGLTADDESVQERQGRRMPEARLDELRAHVAERVSKSGQHWTIWAMSGLLDHIDYLAHHHRLARSGRHRLEQDHTKEQT